MQRRSNTWIKREPKPLPLCDGLIEMRSRQTSSPIVTTLSIEKGGEGKLATADVAITKTEDRASFILLPADGEQSWVMLPNVSNDPRFHFVREILGDVVSFLSIPRD